MGKTSKKTFPGVTTDPNMSESDHAFAANKLMICSLAIWNFHLPSFYGFGVANNLL